MSFLCDWPTCEWLGTFQIRVWIFIHENWSYKSMGQKIFSPVVENFVHFFSGSTFFHWCHDHLAVSLIKRYFGIIKKWSIDDKGGLWTTSGSVQFLATVEMFSLPFFARIMKKTTWIFLFYFCWIQMRVRLFSSVFIYTSILQCTHLRNKIYSFFSISDWTFSPFSLNRFTIN